MLYNVMLVSAGHQHESAIGLQMAPPSWNSLPPRTESLVWLGSLSVWFFLEVGGVGGGAEEMEPIKYSRNERLSSRNEGSLEYWKS